jgi:hypothetical protein
MTKTLCFLLLILLLPSLVSAQAFKRKARKHQLPPKFVLVQLRTGDNKIKFLKKTPGNEEDIRRIQEDIAIVNGIMMRDFTANFSYCPVYFFSDTNWVQITSQRFEGLLMDKDFQVVASPNVSRTDTNYFILNYGIEDNAEEWNYLQTLLAANWQGHQLRVPLPLRPYRSQVRRHYKEYKQYSYVNRKTNIEYRGCAKPYNSSLRIFYKRFPQHS